MTQPLPWPWGRCKRPARLSGHQCPCSLHLEPRSLSFFRPQGCPPPSAAALGFCFAAGVGSREQIDASPCGKALNVSRRQTTREPAGLSGARDSALGQPPLGVRTDSPCPVSTQERGQGLRGPGELCRAGKRAVTTLSDTSRGSCLPKPWCGFLFIILPQKGDFGAESWPHTSPES